jgi:hypothetical protein
MASSGDGAAAKPAAPRRKRKNELEDLALEAVRGKEDVPLAEEFGRAAKRQRTGSASDTAATSESSRPDSGSGKRKREDDEDEHAKVRF